MMEKGIRFTHREKHQLSGESRSENKDKKNYSVLRNGLNGAGKDNKKSNHNATV